MLIGYVTPIVLVGVAAAIAWKFKALDLGGLATALLLAFILMFTSLPVLYIMMAFFFSSSILTFLGYKSKESKGAAERKGGRRTVQVLCSGGVPAALTLVSVVIPSEYKPAVILAAISSIAYANADTWAAELGTLSKKDPILLINPRIRVPPGVSGGITLLGEFGALTGSALIALLYLVVTNGYRSIPIGPAGLIFLLGWLGEILDALLGAILQVKYVCTKCQVLWDHETHICGARTEYLRGYRFIKNEIVNLLTELLISSIVFFISLYL
ncbi:MAG: DUF92 domain-containing protein [Thermofilaceae archaeon]|nr:DUF92 domain-containing protein [Thermofilaceae archaeon]